MEATRFGLSEEQNAVLRTLLSTNENVFLTGEAGTGKSYVIRAFLAAAEEQKLRVACLAPTGIAAIPLKGQTVHRFFRLKAPITGAQALGNLLNARKRVRANLAGVDIILIDEVSMLHGWLFDACEEGARQVLDDERPWGGKRVILVGDFLQLQPVESQRRHAEQWQWCFHSRAWRASRFLVQRLTGHVRQRDPKLLAALGEARRGVVGERLQSILVEASKWPAPRDYMHLFPTRAQARQHKMCLNSLPDPEPVREFRTALEVKADADEDEQVGYDDIPVPEVLRLKAGARVIFRQNQEHDVWVNGTLGTVVSVVNDEMEPLVRVLIDGDDAPVSVPQALFQVVDHTNRILAEATNFPLDLAWGLTIHKSQGLTLKSACIDLASAFTAGQAYVALSRVSSTEGLFIRTFNRDAFFADPDAMSFMESLIHGAPSPASAPPQRIRNLRQGERYSTQDITRILRTSSDLRSLVVTDRNRVVCIKGRVDFNPRLEAGELWVQKGPNRAEQVTALKRTTDPIPLFVKTIASAGKDWKFRGFFRFQSVLEDPRDFPDEAQRAGNVQAVIMLGEVV